MTEEWRSVQGFEGLYEVSNQGRIRGVDRYVNAKNGSSEMIKGIILKANKDHGGYLRVTLHKNNKAYSKTVHRIVAESFIENKNNLPQVNHIDTDKTNNSVSNLEWITNYDNMQHAIMNGCYRDAFTQKAKEAVINNLKKAIEKRKTAVIQLSIDGEVIGMYESMKDAERHTGVNNSKICAVCKGKRKTAGGYTWKYGGNSNE